MNELNSLEKCLYYEYYINIKKCSKYIGFHYCGYCINENTEYYCSKIIENEIFNFYYLENQLNLPYNKRECYWSYNCSNIDDIYYFLNNEKDKISFYKKIIKGSCEIYSEDGNYCIKCNNYKGYYKIENQENECSESKPANNYVLDFEAKEWRKCNQRCDQCKMQSKSEIDHQCLKCSNNYYPYKIDYDNFIDKKISTINCYSLTEVKSKYLNYFLNSDNQFEKCDISCNSCITKNICTKCSDNYYNIYGYENGTCFLYPLPSYGLVNFNYTIYFKKCFNLCKYCSQITQSFLYQQCIECDEIDYTLDIYSLNQSFCIPKDKTNSFFIKEKTKWYIENYDNFYELRINDKNLIIDFQELLDNIKYNNLKYKIVKTCPDDKPYIIYSIRQCVSSCNSNNLIENGLFITKKMYLYNNICYDECPFGSIKDEVNFVCVEINKYTKINKNISLELFIQNNEENILKYLAENANNSVEITRNNDFSNFFIIKLQIIVLKLNYKCLYLILVNA